MTEARTDARIDLRYYSGQDLYTDGSGTEARLLELVTEHPADEFPEVIAREGTWPALYHLSPVRENILNWVPFRPGERVLELGAGCGAVTGAFLNRGLEVTCVDLSLMRSRINAARHRDAEGLTILAGPAERILPEMTGRFGHVTLIGVLEYAAQFSDAEKPFHTLLSGAASALKPGGTLWVAIENRLGLKYFAGAREDHTGRYFEGLEGYPHGDGPRTFSRKELERLAAECGLCSRFYYPYPDYKLPVKIFSDGCLPRKGELTRNWQRLDGESVSLFDEGKVFDGLLEAGLFPEMANSFLVQMRKEAEV